MRISVIGCGYLGAVHAACLADLGHDVVGIDIDESKIRLLAAGSPPFYEPGLAELLTSTVASGRLRFSTDIADARGAAVHFVTVGTPQLEGSNAADLRFVDGAIENLLPHVQPRDLIVGKSTVPVGTAARLAARIAEVAPETALAWNPEFLREGWAVKDTMTPDRFVYGLAQGDERSEALLDEVYAAALATGTPKVVADFATAELVKVSANAFLATKISFINAMAEIAEVTGADVTKLADAIGHDARIGRRFLGAGIGFGGGCLPKDIRAFVARADELGVGESLAFLRHVDEINLRRRARVVELTRELAGGSLEGKTIGVLGLAFKPHSDDVRDSPALDVATRLIAEGALVRAYDPQAVETARARNPELHYASGTLDAVAGVDVVVLVTEWDDFRYLTPHDLESVAPGRAIVDGRNCLNPVQWREAGWQYRSLGRP
ncbi:MAG: UDP-glucose/GDP-mannose dehydrogenase family protein [Cryobacterium sp.]|nr:UDP-glucose/GDP-mannose dehydrogenase family protein [Cryobacterium sp.]